MSERIQAVAEFCTLANDTVAVVTLDRAQVRPVAPDDMRHVRALGGERAA